MYRFSENYLSVYQITGNGRNYREGVIPAKAGIQFFQGIMDARFRGHDTLKFVFL